MLLTNIIQQIKIQFPTLRQFKFGDLFQPILTIIQFSQKQHSLLLILLEK